MVGNTETAKACLNELSGGPRVPGAEPIYVICD